MPQHRRSFGGGGGALAAGGPGHRQPSPDTSSTVWEGPLDSRRTVFVAIPLPGRMDLSRRTTGSEGDRRDPQRHRQVGVGRGSRDLRLDARRSRGCECGFHERGAQICGAGRPVPHHGHLDVETAILPGDAGVFLGHGPMQRRPKTLLPILEMPARFTPKVQIGPGLGRDRVDARPPSPPCDGETQRRIGGLGPRRQGAHRPPERVDGIGVRPSRSRSGPPGRGAPPESAVLRGLSSPRS